MSKINHLKVFLVSCHEEAFKDTALSFELDCSLKLISVFSFKKHSYLLDTIRRRMSLVQPALRGVSQSRHFKVFFKGYSDTLLYNFGP